MQALASMKKQAITWMVSLFRWGEIPMHSPGWGLSDKFAHFFIFLIFALLCQWGLRSQSKFDWLKVHALYITLSATVFLGGATELMQAFFTNYRAGEWLDFTADLLGGVVGILLYRYSAKKRRKYAL